MSAKIQRDSPEDSDQPDVSDLADWLGDASEPADLQEPIPPETCDRCGRCRRELVNMGTRSFPYWECGTCLHRRARKHNTREMYGRGRRGY